jgi:diguanylate cyclase (GGDEF)-like protein
LSSRHRPAKPIQAIEEDEVPDNFAEPKNPLLPTLGASEAAWRTMALSIVLVSGCLAALLAGDLLAPITADPLIDWWVIAPIAVVAQMMVFDVEFRREVYTFTFSEIPLVLGLFLANPIALIAGRLLGELAFLVIKERQAPRKVALNLSSFLTETTVLLAVAHATEITGDIGDPLNWVKAVLAVTVANLCGFAVVHRVLIWHGAPVAFRTIVGLGGVAIPANTSFALLIGILLRQQPWATVLLVSIGAFLMLSYRSYTALRQRFDSLSLLYDFTRLVSGAQRPDAVLEAMLTQAKDLMHAERAEIWLRDGNRVLSLSVDDHGRSSRELPPVGRSLLDRWFEQHSTSTIIRCNESNALVVDLTTMLRADEAIVSAITESGAIVGLVAVIDRIGEVKSFGESDRMMFATLANHAGVALENGRLIDRLHREAKTREHEAMHDALTGLPNRSLFNERLESALRRSTTGGADVGVGLLDLDGFKEINDTLGHQTGDIVLVKVADRLRSAVPPDVFVARLGGDEFALLFTDNVSAARLDTEARRINTAISETLSVDHMSLNVTGSIGLTIALPGTEPATLLQRADVAMYTAKAGHGAGVSFYDAQRDENSPRRLRLANDLRSAIMNRELHLVVQPKVRCADGAIVGWEALSRWQHELGPISPDEFIPIAERTGCIRELTHSVVERAASEAVTWRDAGFDWTVSVNIAVRNLLDDSFVELVAESLRTAGCPPELLMLEITETGAMFDATRAIRTLEELAALGVRVSVDDFGTGYSSLSYLQQLPAVEVKIDKAFVQSLGTDRRAAPIVRTVVDLARNLDLHVVAEGVETAAMWNELVALGCELAQGYHIARPMPLGHVIDWASTWNARHVLGVM